MWMGRSVRTWSPHPTQAITSRGRALPACARRKIGREGEVGVYHCVNRCVRRAFLCGEDPYTGQSFEHRKGWVRERLTDLAGVFAADVCGYAVMSNHLHVILRTRPDRAADWNEEELARRWWRLFPRRRDERGRPPIPPPRSSCRSSGLGEAARRA